MRYSLSFVFLIVSIVLAIIIKINKWKLDCSWKGCNTSCCCKNSTCIWIFFTLWFLTQGIWISGMGSTLSNAGLGIWTLPVQPSSFKWPFSFLRLWPGMRRITIKIPQNRFGIRSTSTSVFTQQSGKPSLILCKRIKWRLSDWFMPTPGWGFLLDQRSKEWCTSTDEASQTPWNQRVTMHVRAYTHTHSLSLFTLEKILSPRGSNLYSSGGSGQSQNLLFSERVVCLNIVCVQ